MIDWGASPPRYSWLSAFHGRTAVADQLILPQAAGRTHPLEAAYLFEKPATGRGFLDIEWSDVDGRVIERHRIPLDLEGASDLVWRFRSTPGAP